MSEEYERLKEALKQAPTEEARKAAAEAMRQYLEKRGGGHSKPTLVSLGKGKTYPNAIELKDIPDELERNPEFFQFMKKIVARER